MRMIIATLRIALCISLLWLSACATSISAPAASTKNLPQGCDLTLEGEVGEGSLKSLKSDYSIASKKFDAIPKKPTESVTFSPTLCLDSPGGNLREALKIIDWLLETTFITTVVPQNAKCFSACALIFMFGNFNEGHGIVGVPSRKLHHLGQLGFHSPHIAPLVDAKDALLSAQAYRSGIKAIGAILEKDREEIFFPKALLIDALKKEPEELLYVDTVQRAASWAIDVFGFEPPKQLTMRMLEAACLNEARSNKQGAKGMMRWWRSNESPTGQREELTAPAVVVSFKNGHHRAVFDKFGDEDAFVCVVDAYRQQDGKLAIDVNFGDSVGDKNIGKPRGLATAKEYGGNSSLWFTFVGKTRLQDLPKKN
ncbi:hypothetical protein CQ12_11500 [Bradyrhizobium jicamae]|uniref:Lipoprotein n=1 Tax=Bradyrhizobium jicamae TaxID=280332 RepID=A0A0R3LEF0_9BRAD|nr:hypothetical protein [Bradyrhizobium jicamae]KRR06204.1 hypothetical protein CQ12_11500 [Bradyrhizobium jicamae]